MKNKKLTIIPIIILGISCIVGFALQKRYAEASNEISLTISSPKNTFQLGEVIPVKVQITNRTSNTIQLKGVGIKIAFKENEDYKLYAPKGPDFTVDGADTLISINPRESFIVTKTILWNGKPDVSHLNSDVAKKYLEGKILTDYAFQNLACIT